MLDGILIANVAHELSQIINSRIEKIYQPSKEEIILTIRSGGKNLKLLLSVNATAPRIHFTQEKLINPQTPPTFCMLLRKHISGKIVRVVQPNFERIIQIHIESTSEMLDITTKVLTIEIMGKHSNIILVNDSGTIIDSIKHVNSSVSSVRQVMPKTQYKLPPSQDKEDFLNLNLYNLKETVENKQTETVQNIIYKSYTGISPNLATILCEQANIDPSATLLQNNITVEELYKPLKNLKEDIQNAHFTPFILKDGKKLKSLHTLYKCAYESTHIISHFETISQAIEYFYTEREQNYRIIQKTSDLKKIVSQNINKCVKKIQKFELLYKEIEKKDDLKLFGELITSNIHVIEKGATQVTLTNFYEDDMSKVTIFLDNTLTAQQNAQAYFKQYNKLKRSEIALKEQVTESKDLLTYLESVGEFLNGNLTDNEINEIREELVQVNILKRKNKTKVGNEKSKPLTYTSVDGYEIIVGKNNKQNDEITLNSHPQDIWLHTKDIAGSHVIIKCNTKQVPNTTITQAAEIAAYYSKGKNGSLVAVDYTQKKFVKKPKGAKPGMVIYTNHKTAYVNPSIAKYIK